MPKYAYSYDREDYTGRFATADAAFHAAVANAEQLGNPPTTIYVGELVTADPQAGDHARSIINAMAQRALVDEGDVARNYLKHVTRAQEQELEAALEQTIRQWLEKNKLMPSFARVRGVREYPVMLPPRTAVSSNQDEVGELGVSEFPSDLGHQK